MKLFNSSNFKDSMDIYLRRMGRTLSMPASNLYRKVKTLVQPSSIARRATNDVMQEVKSLKKPPQTLKAYVLIGEHYIAKRLLFILLLLAIVLPALFINYAYPVIEQKFLVNTMPIDSDEIPGYTGKVRLIDRNTGTLLFAGRLDNGRINGEGTLYDTSGNLIYTGNFQMDAFDGFGELYYANGTMQYMGNFSMNAYEGSGSLFYKSGGKKYVGNFAAGVYEGKGTRYYGNGEKCTKVNLPTAYMKEKVTFTIWTVCWYIAANLQKVFSPVLVFCIKTVKNATKADLRKDTIMEPAHCIKMVKWYTKVNLIMLHRTLPLITMKMV